MNIISAIGSFKGSIDSTAINQKVKENLELKGHCVEAIPVADGGDGLLDSLCAALGGEYINVDTFDALGRPIVAKVAIVGETGIAEMALASGLALLKDDERNPLRASTYGTGILIKELALRGVKSIILGIGGSATNDGGFGCLSALGFEFYDEENNTLIPCGANLQKVKRISDENILKEIENIKIQIACDVTNPLLGESGAAYIYGRQKGADDEMLAILERGMESYSKVVASFCGADYTELAGAGAAGGLGLGLMSMLNAELKKGAQIVLQHAGYAEKLRTAELVITGEGQIDNQTEFGKLPQIVATTAKNAGVNCIALVGSSTADKDSLERMGITATYQLIDFATFDECMNNTEAVVDIAIDHIFK